MKPFLFSFKIETQISFNIYNVHDLALPVTMSPILSPSTEMRSSSHLWSSRTSLSLVSKLSIQRPPALLAGSSQSGATPALKTENDWPAFRRLHGWI